MESATIRFAQRLAGNEKRTRDRAIRRLTKYLSLKADFSELDLLKLWKGLHFCLWMQDKPLLQEQLVSRMADLVEVMATRQQALLFLRAFFLTQAREWNTIDIWRVDKFMLLVRQMIRKGLKLLLKVDWAEESVREWNAVVSSVMVPSEDMADGLRYHIADLYLDEITRVSDGEISEDTIFNLLHAFRAVVCRGKNKVLVKRILAKVFEPLCKELPKLELEEEEESSDTPRLQVSSHRLADLCMTWGGLKSSKNTTILYALVRRLRNLKPNASPQKISPSQRKGAKEGKDFTEQEIDQACQSWESFEERIMRENLKRKEMKKKKKKMAAEEEELSPLEEELSPLEEELSPLEEEADTEEPLLDSIEEDSCEQPSEEPADGKSKKKRRRRKRKQASMESPEAKKMRLADGTSVPSSDSDKTARGSLAEMPGTVEMENSTKEEGSKKKKKRRRKRKQAAVKDPEVEKMTLTEEASVPSSDSTKASGTSSTEIMEVENGSKEANASLSGSEKKRRRKRKQVTSENSEVKMVQAEEASVPSSDSTKASGTSSTETKEVENGSKEATPPLSGSKRKRRKKQVTENSEVKKMVQTEETSVPSSDSVKSSISSSVETGEAKNGAKEAAPLLSEEGVADRTPGEDSEGALRPGEVEIWVPSRKYQAKQKRKRERLEGGKTKSSPSSNGGSSKPEFFGPLQAVSNQAPGVVRLSARKAGAKTTPAAGRSANASASETPNSEKKKVIFNLSQNLQIDFNKTDMVSPQPFTPAFSPGRQPENGILKPSPVTTRAAARRKASTAARKAKAPRPVKDNQKSTAATRSKTPARTVEKRATRAAVKEGRMKAADFF